MIRFEHRTDPVLGALLWMSDGKTELAAALDIGVRIVQLHAVGEKDLLYHQPEDLSDGLTTQQGWRIFGGHRFWASPESERSYYPDCQPVIWEQLPDGVCLRQAVDPWTAFEKTLTVRLLPDGRIEAAHVLTNCGQRPSRAAAWGVTTLCGGGEAYLPFPRTDAGEYYPSRAMALWGGTSLADERLRFEPDAIRATHLPMETSLKIGISSSTGELSMTNFGQRLRIEFAPLTPAQCSDCGCNAEVYLNRHIMELETLGPLTLLQPGESTTHTEYWHVERLTAAWEEKMG